MSEQCCVVVRRQPRRITTSPLRLLFVRYVTPVQRSSISSETIDLSLGIMSLTL